MERYFFLVAEGQIANVKIDAGKQWEGEEGKSERVKGWLEFRQLNR